MGLYVRAHYFDLYLNVGAQWRVFLYFFLLRGQGLKLLLLLCICVDDSLSRRSTVGATQDRSCVGG